MGEIKKNDDPGKTRGYPARKNSPSHLKIEQTLFHKYKKMLSMVFT